MHDEYIKATELLAVELGREPTSEEIDDKMTDMEAKRIDDACEGIFAKRREAKVTDPKTLARTNDPQTSKDAAEKMVKSGALSWQEKMVLLAITRYWKDEFTTKEVAKYMSIKSVMPYYKAYDICKRRFSGLERHGKIELVVREGITHWPSGEPVYKRRDGCRVWRLK